MPFPFVDDRRWVPRSPFSKVLLAGLALLVAIGVAVGVSRPESAPQGKFAYSLASTGRGNVTQRTFAGRWQLIYFGYTYCPDVCPTTLGHVADALSSLGPLSDRLQPIFITVDPQRDTIALLGSYLKNFDDRIIGLSGDSQATAAAAKSFGVYFARQRTGPGPNDYLMDHSSFLYLLKPDGSLATVFPPDLDGDGLAVQLKPFLQS